MIDYLLRFGTVPALKLAAGWCAWTFVAVHAPALLWVPA